MANWTPNGYFPFTDTNKDSNRIVTTLLDSYSLTSGCLQTLGEELKSRLEYGFFDDGRVIIQQNESGRDIFMLCSGTIDVLVDDQVVVQMFAPTLVGDKGIVSQNSQRAASIKIAGDQALVVKIPMGSFIREFKDKRISDSSFSQEKNIFESVFQAVQQRLFEYIHLQKSLWEQVTNMISLLNSQIVAKQLDNQKSPGWSADIWQIVQNFLKAKYNISWPANVPINEKSLFIFLRRILDRKYADASIPGIAAKKTSDWRNMLSGIATRVLKSLPDQSKPIPPLDLELFNPNIYRMRITGLLNQLEKRYTPNKTGASQEKALPPSSFFGKGDRANEFNLSQYLAYFAKYFTVTNPNRLLAQVAQKCAMIAAECENSFNVSVVKMQKFMEEVKARNISLNDSTEESKTDPVAIQSWITTIGRGIGHFQDTANTVQSQAIGVVQFNPKTFPTFANLLKAHRVKFTRDQMNQAFNSLMKALSFQTEYMSAEILHNHFHLSFMDRGDVVPHEEVTKNLWFTLSDDVILNSNESQVVNLKACMFLGKGLLKTADSDQTEEVNYRLTSEKPTLLLILRADRLPWYRDSDPDPVTLVEDHLPLMQWFIDRGLDQFVYLISSRDRVVKEWRGIQNSLIQSKKIEVFEQKSLKLPKDSVGNIVNMLNSRLNMNLDANVAIVSNQLSKKIYNAILHKIKLENPELSVEQCGNQAYTQWRNTLIEVVNFIPALNKVASSIPGRSPRPALNVLAKQLTPVLSPLMKETWDKRNPITAGTPNLNLLSILHPDQHASTQDIINIYISIFDIITSNTSQLITEIENHKSTLSQLYDLQSGVDTSAGGDMATVDMQLETAKALVVSLQGMNTEGA